MTDADTLETNLQSETAALDPATLDPVTLDPATLDPVTLDPATFNSSSVTVANSQQEQEREFEKSGCYPAEGKPFRMWALFGWLTFLIVALAGVSALLNFWLLDTL